MKTWNEIRTETLNLGFEKVKSYNKNKQAYVDAYNWAQTLIASTIGGVLSQLEIKCTRTDRVQVYDLEKLADEKDETFIALSRTGVTDKKTGYKVNDIHITDNRYLNVSPRYEGDMTVHYYCMPPAITTSSSDDTVCILPVKWANIMPYLIANRLYLDDDAGKAGYYWNLFVEMRDSILQQESKSAVSVTGGIDIDGWCFE